ncbi:cytochrome C biogenesis protein CcdA [Leptolyngbya sp. 'hensonii']|uniref:cytochrome c biogenesis CcdA family protein n=1 Tax=Leptolyngbya sp. 'hensonii' TaxID=1922337 RepID=UPI00094FFDA0|nr:cytochrome c biogenesis protein CcdA [Leptolyngbya sp. 'hensonii']OLP16953.1 cytochrome C biogenesis protein CcdA [Leptolyngbya sp. 'hensonii']
MATGSLSIGLALAGGALTVLSPCVLPILPVLVGRSLQTHFWGPVALVAGLVTGFALTGSLLGVTASWLAPLASWLRMGAIVLLLSLGLLSLFPDWSYRLFSFLPLHHRGNPSVQVGLVGEFWLGTQLGLLWTPCAGPVLGSILILAAVHHRILDAFVLLLLYGLGAALPLLGIAYGGRSLSRSFLRLRSRAVLLQRIGGILIVSAAIAILLGWDVQLQLWLAPFLPTSPL